MLAPSGNAAPGQSFEEARKHWAYQPIQHPAPPKVKAAKQWPRVEIVTSHAGLAHNQCVNRAALSMIWELNSKNSSTIAAAADANIR